MKLDCLEEHDKGPLLVEAVWKRCWQAVVASESGAFDA
jgi:hypothetical protein